MCNCIAEMNEALKAHNTKLAIPIRLTPQGLQAGQPVIATEKVEGQKRQGPIKLFATFCPFCGEKYGEGHEKAN